MRLRRAVRALTTEYGDVSPEAEVVGASLIASLKMQPPWRTIAARPRASARRGRGADHLVEPVRARADDRRHGADE